ncbi:hypothetical protein CsatB_005719 [Cannabis sativa]|uniref:Uncharacterized protein n=1 Tax=Cannabis sativa TaxID=3483 RepID=A0A7J6G355_CANSA|nr:hypothetical protein G4B88_017215 [Cannabis sativa]
MGKSLRLCNFLLIAILILIASSNKVVMGELCNVVLSDYTCKHAGFDKRCKQECTENFPQSKSICEALKGAPTGVFACRCSYQC